MRPWHVPRRSSAAHEVSGRNGGYIVSQSGPFQSSPPALARFRGLLPEGGELHHYALDLRAIKAREPSFDEAQFSQIRFEARTADCPGTVHRPNARVMPLNAEISRALVLEDESFRPLSFERGALAISLPVDENLCFAGKTPTLRVFGSAETLWPPDQRVGSELALGTDPFAVRAILSATRLGPERLAIHSAQVVGPITGPKPSVHQRPGRALPPGQVSGSKSPAAARVAARVGWY